MKIIVCISDERGIAFNGRRQSRDRELIAIICDTLSGQNIRMSSYSESLFKDFYHDHIVVDDENYIKEAGENDYCFIELTTDFLEYKEKIKEIVLFKWNRKYPSDVFLPEIEEIVPEMKMVETMNFPGGSHDEITLEVYAR